MIRVNHSHGKSPLFEIYIPIMIDDYCWEKVLDRLRDSPKFI